MLNGRTDRQIREVTCQVSAIQLVCMRMGVRSDDSQSDRLEGKRRERENKKSVRQPQC